MDRAKAFVAAKKLNALLMSGGDLVSKVVGSTETVADAVRLFREDDIPHRGWAPKTAAWYEVFIRRIEEDLGKIELESLTVNACATYIRDVTESPRSRQTYRLVLGWILDCAVQEGWIDINPAAQTRKFGHTRKRERLTIEWYNAIHAASPIWLQNAMDVSLITLLRREDVAAAKFNDAKGDWLCIIPMKTEGSTQLRLRIKITDSLQTLIARCRADNIASPYLIHRIPERMKPQGQRSKRRDHHTQVLPEQITRAFAEVRDSLGIGGDNPPTFHEIRSLGGAMLIKEQGWTKEQVRELMGHGSVSMTEVYLDGHDLPWSEVSPGLSLPA